jgi:magnesium transporter
MTSRKPDQRDQHAAPSAEPRVKAVACLGGVSLERGVPTAEIHEYVRDPTNLVWLDVQDPGPEELSMLLEEFGFHPLAIEDVAKGQQRPKVDEYRGYLFVVTYGVVPGGGPCDLQTAEVDLFVGRNYVVSVHRGRVPALEDALARWTRGGPLLREGVGFLVYTLMDALIDGYFPVIDAIENEAEETELSMFDPQRAVGVQELLQLKRTLVAVRRVLYPLRETFHVFLRPDHAYFSPATLVYFQDVHSHILRILDVVDVEREVVTGALEAYLTVASNRLNQTMRTLALITVAVAILSAVFGAWGMNFESIPLAGAPWGFAAVVCGTLALITLLVVVGRRRRWM